MLEVKVERCAGIGRGKEVFGSVRSNWIGKPEAGGGGSAIRHDGEGIGND